MSLEDGDKINRAFQSKQKTLDSLKLTIDSLGIELNKSKVNLDSLKLGYNLIYLSQSRRLQQMSEDYLQANENYKQEKIVADSLRAMYMANKKIYEKREKDFNFERRAQQFFTAAIMVITALLAFIH